jgi:hypothetical protein
VTISTYTELQTALGNYAIRSDMATLAPEYIALAEAVINRRLRARQMTTTTTGTITGGDGYLTLPTGFLGVRQFRLTGGSYYKLEAVSLDRMDELKAQTDISGEPQAYALRGLVAELYPEPAEDTTYRLTYYQSIPALADNSTNWLLTAHPDVYLYGSLIEFGIRTQDERTQTWAQRFEAALGSVRDFDELMGGERISPSINRSIA